MFPDPCGDALEASVNEGVDPARVVPDDFIVVRGGTSPIPAAGELFSCFAGPTLIAAGEALLHNQVRVTTAGAIRAAGGTVVWEVDEPLATGIINMQHVHVTEVGPTTFSEPQPNPAPKSDRVPRKT